MAAISCQVGEWAFRTDVATELVEALDEGLSPGAITGREPGEPLLANGRVIFKGRFKSRYPEH
jgi:hypothetical protein